MTTGNGGRRRITLVSWAPFLGGAEIAAERLAAGLSGAGHDVLVVVGTEGPVAERFRNSGFRVRHIEQRFTDKRHWLRYRRSMRALMRELEVERPDVVHSNDLPTHQMVSDAAGRLGIPRVCHHRWVFGGQAIDWLNKYGAERHLFVSDYLMRELCGQSTKLSAAECTVVYDGLPFAAMPGPADRLAARSRLGLPEDRTIVLFAGQVIERKGVADLIRAWGALGPEVRDRALLLIVGDDLEGRGEYRRQMESLAEQLGNPVRFVGFQTNISEWLTAADLAVVPSHVEPLGNATLEAMAHGLPVLGTRAGGIPEMIVEGETGLLVAPQAPEELAAALTRLLGAPDLRRELGLGGRKRCEALFSLDAHIASVVTHYEAVIKQTVGASG